MITKRDIVKILFTLFTLIGATAGVVLTQQPQDIREKATNTCISAGGYCMDGGCPQGYSGLGRTNCPVDFKCCKPLTTCVTEGNICNEGIPSKKCCEPLICKYTEDSGPDPVCTKPITPPGGNGSGGQCSSASATKCQGKNPGDSCGSGKKCQKTGQNGSDGKPKCTCAADKGNDNSCDKNPNPTVLDITNDGEVAISFASFPESTSPKIALKKNSQTCNLTEYDKLIDTKDTTPSQLIRTGIQAQSGGKLCIYVEGISSNNSPHPFEGWIEPEGNKCKDKDISPIVQVTQDSGATIVSQQCWGSYAPLKGGCDFDDYALIISLYNTSSSKENIKILFRQQGITSQVLSDIPSQLDTFINLTSEGSSYTIEKAVPSINDSGVWTISLSTDDQGNPIPNGTYSLSIKGISHLKKRFDNIKIENNTVTIDKSTDTKDELKAGDVNNDNIISIEDISQVLRFYTDFKIKVDSLNKNMVSADINKDGYITIDDLALVALNWSDFVVKGDE